MPESLVLKTKNSKLDKLGLDICVGALKRGEVLVFPTDTVYGIGCNAFSPHGIEQIYKLKGRQYSKPLPIFLGHVDQLPLVARDIPAEAYKLIDAYWPGPLTLIFKTAPMVLNAARGKGTIAVRIPDHVVSKQLLEALGLPLAVTSANKSGQGSTKTFSQVKKIFSDIVPTIVDGGKCHWGKESSVVDVSHYPFSILREGAISKKELEEKIYGSR